MDRALHLTTVEGTYTAALDSETGTEVEVGTSLTWR